MRGAVIHAPGDVRFETLDDPKSIKPTDAVIRTVATCVCGSDLWDFRGLNPVEEPHPMGHEYVGVVEDVGSEVTSVRPGQSVIGSFATSDNSCPNRLNGYQSNCLRREFMSTWPSTSASPTPTALSSPPTRCRTRSSSRACRRCRT